MKIALISGSGRKDSLNTQLARLAEKDLAGKAQVFLLDYSDLPMFSQDLEFPAPKAVVQVRDALRDADGLWFFCPEYNGNITPLLLNLVDWLSRPENPQDGYFNCMLRNKAYTISGIGGRGGTARAQKRLEEMLNFLGMHGYTEKDVMLKMSPEVMMSSSLSSLPEAAGEIENQAAGFLAFLQTTDKEGQH